MMVRTSYLRVYQPPSAFPAEERDRLLSKATEDGTWDLAASRRWLIAAVLPDRGPLAGATEGAYIRRDGEALLICPWRTSLRMFASVLAFRNSIPEEVAEAFVPEREARRAAHELSQLSEQHPEIKSHILHANWHVPLRWFAAFDDTERILTEDKDGLRIRYETSLAEARMRLERALQTLETSWIDDGVVGAVRELAQWLQEFAGEGLLELDYGTVAGMFTHEDLLEDRSAGDVGACLDALDNEDVVRAGRLFASLTERWAEARGREVVN